MARLFVAALDSLWLALLGYRVRLTSREEDALFLRKGETKAAEEQRVVVDKLNRLRKPLWAAGISVGVLLLLILGIWLWRAMNSVP
jgi:hypothetical protein